MDLSLTCDDIIDIITTTRHNPTQVFLLRYTFQATVHSIWRERNSRRHGEQPCDANSLTKFVDKKAPLIMLSVQGKGYKHLDEGYTNLVWDMVTRFSYNMKLKHIFSFFIKFSFWVINQTNNRCTWCTTRFDWINFTIHSKKNICRLKKRVIEEYC